MKGGYTTKGYPLRNRSVVDAMALDDFLYTPAWRDSSSFRRQSTAVVLDGRTDARFQYLVNAADFATDNANFGFSFLHGLDFVPLVDGSVFIPSDDKRRPLPFFYLRADGDSYAALPPSGLIVVESVDDIYINIRVTLTDIFGYSFIASNTLLTFRFYCRNEALI